MNAPVSQFQNAEIKILHIERQVVDYLKEQGPVEIDRVQLEFKRQRVDDKLEYLMNLLLVARTELKRARATETGPVQLSAPSAANTSSPETESLMHRNPRP